MPDARCTRGLMRNVHKECVHEHTGQRIICDAVSRWRRPDRAEALSAPLMIENGANNLLLLLVDAAAVTAICEGRK